MVIEKCDTRFILNFDGIKDFKRVLGVELL
jgi:hypothetical protein